MRTVGRDEFGEMLEQLRRMESIRSPHARRTQSLLPEESAPARQLYLMGRIWEFMNHKVQQVEKQTSRRKVRS
jgi:hypothetical protein